MQKADRKFVTGLIHLIEDVRTFSEMKQISSESNPNAVELAGGYFDGLKVCILGMSLYNFIVRHNIYDLECIAVSCMILSLESYVDILVSEGIHLIHPPLSFNC